MKKLTRASFLYATYVIPFDLTMQIFAENLFQEISGLLNINLSHENSKCQRSVSLATSILLFASKHLDINNLYDFIIP